MGGVMNEHIPEQRQDAFVVYPVGELLAGIRNDMTGGFSELKTLLLNKADKADVARLEGRLNRHEEELTKLRSRQDLDDAARGAVSAVRSRRAKFWAWAIPLVPAVALAIDGIYQAGGFR